MSLPPEHVSGGKRELHLCGLEKWLQNGLHTGLTEHPDCGGRGGLLCASPSGNLYVKPRLMASLDSLPQDNKNAVGVIIARDILC